MAAKFYCDGCDDEIANYSDGNKWSVDVRNDKTAKVLSTFDLCQPCARHLAGVANPRGWTRQDKPKSKVA